MRWTMGGAFFLFLLGAMGCANSIVQRWEPGLEFRQKKEFHSQLTARATRQGDRLLVEGELKRVEIKIEEIRNYDLEITYYVPYTVRGDVADLIVAPLALATYPVRLVFSIPLLIMGKDPVISLEGFRFVLRGLFPAFTIWGETRTNPTGEKKNVDDWFPLRREKKVGEALEKVRVESWVESDEGKRLGKAIAKATDKKGQIQWSFSLPPKVKVGKVYFQWTWKGKEKKKVIRLPSP